MLLQTRPNRPLAEAEQLIQLEYAIGYQSFYYDEDMEVAETSVEQITDWIYCGDFLKDDMVYLSLNKPAEDIYQYVVGRKLLKTCAKFSPHNLVLLVKSDQSEELERLIHNNHLLSYIEDLVEHGRMILYTADSGPNIVYYDVHPELLLSPIMIHFITYYLRFMAYKKVTKGNRESLSVAQIDKLLADFSKQEESGWYFKDFYKETGKYLSNILPAYKQLDECILNQVDTRSIDLQTIHGQLGLHSLLHSYGGWAWVKVHPIIRVIDNLINHE